MPLPCRQRISLLFDRNGGFLETVALFRMVGRVDLMAWAAGLVAPEAPSGLGLGNPF